MLNDCGAVEVVEVPPATVVVQENCCPPQVIELGVMGPQGPIAAATFESISKNLRALPGVFAFDQDGRLSTLTYDGGEVVKTFAYTTAGKLASVTLSGAGVPQGIPVTKSFTYSAGGQLAGFTYEQ